MNRDPELTPEEKARLLDPKNNELIPGFEIPAEPPNELCPDYIEPPEIPELSPDYVEPPPKKTVQTEDLMSFLTDAAAGIFPAGCNRKEVEIASGLVVSHCEAGGGISIFRDGKQLYSTEDLTADEKRQIEEFREKFSK